MTFVNLRTNQSYQLYNKLLMSQDMHIYIETSEY